MRESPKESRVFGNNTSNSRTAPVTLFTFNVYGPEEICNLFRFCLENESEQFEWPSRLPMDEFTVDLDIACKEAMRGNCYISQHMEITEEAESEDDVD